MAKLWIGIKLVFFVCLALGAIGYGGYGAAIQSIELPSRHGPSLKFHGPGAIIVAMIWIGFGVVGLYRTIQWAPDAFAEAGQDDWS